MQVGIETHVVGLSVRKNKPQLEDSYRFEAGDGPDSQRHVVKVHSTG